jgi:hypothetical protein
MVPPLREERDHKVRKKSEGAAVAHSQRSSICAFAHNLREIGQLGRSDQHRNPEVREDSTGCGWPVC